MVYGKTHGLAVDPVEKKPLYHFFPGQKALSFGTVGCNFSCEFCQNSSTSQWTRELKEHLQKLGKETLSAKFPSMVAAEGDVYLPEQIVKTCVAGHHKMIAYTYNEPTIFLEYALDTARLAKERGIYNVFVTNGYESDECLERMKGLIDAMNIDVKAFTEEFYATQCSAKLSGVLATVKKAKELGIWVELTTLLIPGLNDGSDELEKLARWIAEVDPSMPWHLSAFHPSHHMTDVEPTPPKTLFRAYEIAKRAGIQHCYLGNIWGSDCRPEGTSTFCAKCHAVLIDRMPRPGGLGRSSRIVSENLLKGGTCAKCGTKLPGFFD